MPFRLDPNQSPTTPTQPKGFRPEKKTLQGFAGNVVKSGANLVKGIGEAAVNVVNPDLEKNTVANLARTVYDTGEVIGNKLTGQKTKDTNKFKQLADFYKTRYGGWENIGNTLYNDPVGAAMDASIVAGGVSGLSRAGANALGSTRLANTANVFSKVATATDPLTYLSKGAGKIAEIAKPQLGKAADVLEAGSERLVTRGMGNPMKLKEAKSVSPVSMEELFSKYNTYERTPEAFQEAIKQATSKIDDLTAAAAKSGSKVDVLKVLDYYNAEIKKLTELAPTSDTAAQQLAELSRRKDMFIQAIGGTSSTPLNVDVGKVKDIKKAFQGDLPETSFGKPQTELNKAGGTKIAYKGLIKGIEDAVPGTQELGREQSALIKLKKIAENQASRAGAKQVFNFTKLGSAGLGGVLAGVPGAIAGFATEQFLNSPQFIKFASKGMREIADRIRSIKSSGPMTIVKAKKLTADERALEEMFAQEVLDNPKKYKEMYQKMYPKYGNTDEARKLSPLYDKKKYLSAGVHEPASFIMEQVMQDVYKDPKIKNVMFTSGGTGAGKTTGFEQFPELKKLQDTMDYTLDTNLAKKPSALRKIGEMRDAGKNVSIVHTYADPVDAFDRMVGRAKRTGRTVPMDVHTGTYRSNQLIGELSKELKGKVKTYGVDNTRSIAERKMVNPETYFMSPMDEEMVMKKLAEILKKNKDLSPEQIQTILAKGQTDFKTGSYQRRPINQRSNIFKGLKASKLLNPSKE